MSQIIDTSKLQSGFVTEVVLEEINKFIRIACDLGAEVRGDYLRTVLVPRQFDPKCDVSFKSLDLKFVDTPDEFIKFMGDRLQFDTEDDTSLYFNLIIDQTRIAYVRIFKDLPIEDFDIDALSFTYNEGVPEWNPYFSLSYKRESGRKTLKRRIMAKEARLKKHVLDTFCLDTPEAQKDQARMFKRFDEDFHQCGWKIMIPTSINDSITCPSSAFDSPILFRAWIRENYTISREAIRKIVDPEILKIQTSYYAHLEDLQSTLGDAHPFLRHHLEEEIKKFTGMVQYQFNHRL